MGFWWKSRKCSKFMLDLNWKKKENPDLKEFGNFCHHNLTNPEGTRRRKCFKNFHTFFCTSLHWRKLRLSRPMAAASAEGIYEGRRTRPAIQTQMENQTWKFFGLKSCSDTDYGHPMKIWIREIWKFVPMWQTKYECFEGTY